MGAKAGGAGPGRRSPAGGGPAAAWPSATDDGWASLRADDTHQAVCWVEEWPPTPVRPDFLSPLLLGPRCTGAVSLTVAG